MIRVLVADDHPVVRSGLRAILARQCSISTLGEAETGAEVHRLIAQKPWDVVVLDVSLPDCNGLEVAREIKRARPKRPILILSGPPEGDSADRPARALRPAAASGRARVVRRARVVHG